ncbi:MAG: ABC transporter ATP-binding protein [Candidatus Thorarchaeota archaeon]
MSESHIIVMRDVTKRFGPVEALRGVDLQVESGVFGLIGPNGAGKTTIIRIILGLIRPDGGRATVLGLDVVRDSVEIRKRVGVLHERPSFPKFMTADAFLETVCNIYGQEKDVLELLEMVGLGDAAHRQIGGFSAGMIQRLGIAQTLAGSPEVIILDEPTANLDVSGRREIMDLIARLHDQTGTSFVISSHILTELDKMCDSVAFIRRGRVIESGRVSEILDKHARNRYRVNSSDSRRLIERLRGADWIVETSVYGIKTASIQVKGLDMQEVWSRLQEAAGEIGVEIYGFSKAVSLEDIYDEIIDRE